MRLYPAPGVVLSFALALASPAVARDLTFEERVDAQEAIERVHYSRQIGTTRPFEEAVPRPVVEEKVRTYLKENVALERLWHTPVTADMVRAEATRMERQSRMPDRLRELHAALGDDPFLIQECLARPVLVDRLAHNFFTFDGRIHADARAEATELRRRLVTGELDPGSADPRRTVLQFERAEPGQAVGSEVSRISPPPTHVFGPARRPLTPEDFALLRGRLTGRTGEVGPLVEEREVFMIQVALNQAPDRLRVAAYQVDKVAWEAWWAQVESTLDEQSVTPVAAERSTLSLSRLADTATPACPADDAWDNQILGDLPTARTRPVAVWTGSEMVVWGGRDRDFNDLNTGGRYDPATDTWRSMSRKNAPHGGTAFKGIWTGREMIVWGHPIPGAAEGGRYDPVSDSWTSMSNLGAPAAVGSFSLVWTGRLAVIWGGTTSGFDILSSGARYDPLADTWTPTSLIGAPEPRRSHAAVWTGATMIVWGGNGRFTGLRNGGRYDPESDSWQPISTVDGPLGSMAVWTGSAMIVWQGHTGSRYDPASDSWAPISSANAPYLTGSQTAIWTGRKMIVWGEDQTFHLANAGGLYDPGPDTWVSVSKMNQPSDGMAEFSTVWTGNLMVVWGGQSGGPATNKGGRYDPETDTWTPTSTANAPSPRYGHKAVWTGSLMIVWGGYGSDNVRNTGGRYDPAIDTWKPTSVVGAPAPRFAHTAVWTGESMILWGGYESPSYGVPLNSGPQYHPLTDTWSMISNVGAPAPRVEHESIWTGQDMIVWGGWDPSSESVLNTGGRYDPVTDTWTPTSMMNAPEGRAGHTAVWTGRVMIVWGGCDGNGCMNTGTSYDPLADTWSIISAVNVPIGRFAHTAEWTGRFMIVWGGQDAAGVPLNSGGRYDPVTDTWTPTSLLSAPAGRFDHTAVWTGRLLIVWGGRDAYSSFSFFNTGGTYDPVLNIWTPTSMTDPPSGRYQHTGIWTGRMMLIWGGVDFYLSLRGAGYSLACQPPLAVAAADERLECTSPGGAEVVLDGSGSTDQDSTPGTNDDITSFDWFKDFGIPSQQFLGSGEIHRATLPLGSHLVTLRAMDAEGAVATDLVEVQVVDTTPPEVFCPLPKAAECASPEGAATTFSATATDLCSPTVAVINNRTPGGADASKIYPLGVTPVIFTATDAAGKTSTCSSAVTVQDTTPPVLLLSAPGSPVVWPPNHRMVPVHAVWQVTDECDPVVGVLLVSATSSEPDDAPGNGDGNTTGDIQDASVGVPDPTVLLRAERSGDGPGRVYALTYVARDASGNLASALGIVTVPHDEARGPEPLVMSVEGIGVPGMAHLYWNAVIGAETYDVIRGDLSQVRVSNGETSLGPVHVVAAGQAGASYSEGPSGAIPAMGRAFFYLVQYRDQQGASGWGTESSPWPAEPSSCDVGCPGEPVSTSVPSMNRRRK